MSIDIEGQEFLAPDNGGWHYTTMRDWIAVCPDISATAIRLYWIIRSIMHEKGDRSRRLSIDQLCWLLPGVNGKPTSTTRVKDALRELEKAGLLSNPEGSVTRQWVTDPKTGKRTRENFRRWQIHDHAPQGYGGWRSAIAKLAAYPGAGWQNTESRKSAPQAKPKSSAPPSPAETSKTPGHTESRNSAQSGRISDQTGRNSGDYNAPTSENPPSNKSFKAISLTNQPGGGPSTAPAVEAVPASSGWLAGDQDPKPEPPADPAPEPTTPGDRFLAELAARNRPDRRAIQRLAPKVTALLAAEWSETDLRQHLTVNTTNCPSPVGVLITRLDRLPMPTERRTPAGRPEWCGECDESTRLRELDDGGFAPCPTCSPRARSRTSAA